MLKAIAIDDEPIALEVIKTFSEKVMIVEIVSYFTNCFEALDYLNKHRIDLVFLDIRMPDISGIDFLKAMAQPPMIVFTTAYSDHAVQGFELNAIDYILKPFSLSRFLKACNKAYYQFKLEHNASGGGPATFFIKSGYEQIRLTVAEICYVESSGNYMQFVLGKQKILSRLTMGEVEALLPPSQFLRIHRSFLVAKDHIKKFDRRSVWVNETELPVGSSYVNEIVKLATHC